MKIRAEIILKNDAICEALDALGWSQSRLARECDIAPERIGRMIRFDLRGFTESTFRRVADALGLSIDDVNPPELRQDVGKVRVRYEWPRVTTVVPTHGPERRIDLADAMARLSEADRSILVRHHGLNGHTEETLEEIAHTLGVSRQRIQQRTKRAYEVLRGRSAVLEWAKA